MTQETLTSAIDRFCANESRVNIFANEEGHYTTSGNENVETLPSFISRVTQDADEVIHRLSVITPRGAWTNTTAYALRDLVSYSGDWYICVTAHTSSSSFSTDAATKWRIYQGVTEYDLLGISPVIYQTATALRAVAAPSRYQVCHTAGCLAVGDSGGGLWRWDEESTALDNTGTVLCPSGHAGAGRWVRMYDGRINCLWFGADPTGAADSAAAIQAAIDTSIYGQTNSGSGGNNRTVYLPGGKYLLGTTVHLGYGITFDSVTLEGDGYQYRADNRFNGTSVYVTFTDRPAFSIQAARGTEIRGISINGPLAAYINDNLMGSSNAPLVDDTVMANWDAPGFSATCDSQFAPFAAIAIDPYSGVRPATSYPNVTYPSWLGTVPQYGKSYSSDILIEDVHIDGFTVGIVNQPSNADGNGDFTYIRRCFIERCKWGISVGNTQARNTRMELLKASRMYAIFTNKRHGKKLGKFGGEVADLSIFGSINIFDFTAYYPGPMVFTNIYAESLWRLGDIDFNGITEPAYLFNGGEFNFQTSDARGRPANLLSLYQQAVACVFNGCTFQQYHRACTIQVKGAQFNECYFRDSTATELYEKFAYNATCGGLILHGLENASKANAKITPYNLTTGIISPVASFTYKGRYSQRLYGAPWYTECLVPYSGDDNDQIIPPNLVYPFAKSSFASSSISGLILTIEFSSLAEWAALLRGPLPGDVLLDSLTNTVFFVKSRTGTTVVAVAQNNYKSDGLGDYVLRDAYSTTSGTLYCRNSRLYTPPYYLRGDTTAGSAVITNCARDDGYAAWYDAEIAVGDMIVIPSNNYWMNSAVSIITARDQAAGTITVSASTGMRTTTRTRLQWFIRTGAPNA